MDNHQKHLENKFRHGGYRVTMSRRTILDILRSGSKPLSAEDIYLTIKSKNKNVGLTTIYRAVNELVKAGLLRKIVSNVDRFQFELIGEHACEHHHQLTCRKCGVSVGYKNFSEEEISLIKRIEKLVSKKQNFEIEDHQLCFIGTCKRCQKVAKGK